ncbi:MAG: hypothetical protein ACOYOK_06040 [Pseudobdellovibrionaceae bacterium]
MNEVSTTSQLIHWFIFLLPYVLGIIFVIAAFLRAAIYFTVGRHEWFAKEFEKRVNKFMDKEIPGEVKDVSFFKLAKKNLEQTYYEAFDLRDRFQRRRGDKVMGANDRIFLIKQGCAWLVKDILKQLKFLKWHSENPKLLNITKATFSHNPCFNRIFGVIPMASVNDFISILPGLFVVAGILGTFLGIRGGISELGGMNLADIENTKNSMDNFLQEIAYAMTSSIIGIMFSLLLHIWNVFLNPERVFVSMIDRFESSLDLLWYRSDNNEYPIQDPVFDENKDPAEALAAEAVNLEVTKRKRTRSMDKLAKPKAS